MTPSFPTRRSSDLLGTAELRSRSAGHDRGSSGSLRWRGTLLLAFRTDLRLSADAFRKGPGLGRIGLQSRGRGSAGAAFHKAGPRCGTYTVRLEAGDERGSGHAVQPGKQEGREVRRRKEKRGREKRR